MDTSLANISLKELYTNAQKLCSDLQKLDVPSNSAEYQEKLNIILSLFETCELRISRLDLFSENETLHDLQTNTLAYLILPSYQANGLLKKQGDRVQLLKKSKDLLVGFVEKTIQLEIIDKEDEMYYKSSFAGVKTNATESRQLKIERYKAEKKLKDEINRLKSILDGKLKKPANKDVLSNLVMKDFSSGVGTISFGGGQQRNDTGDNGDDDGNEYDGEANDEVEREHAILLARLQVKIEIENIIMINSELELLEKFSKLNTQDASNKSQPRQMDLRAPGRQSEIASEVDWKLESGTNSFRPGGGPNSGRLLDNKGKPIQTFVITDQRSQIKKGVFQPGYNLPTKSIEQFIDEEFERGNVITGGGKEPEEEIIDEDDEDAVDAETMKQRKWDEFTDSVVKGSGNSSNRG